MSHRYLKLLGYIEGSSLLAILFVTTPLKWFADIPEPSRIVGTLHGCLFLMYVVTIISSRASLGLTRRQVLAGVALACLPFGPFYFESKIVIRRND